MVDDRFDSFLVTVLPSLLTEDFSHPTHARIPSVEAGRRFGVIGGAAAPRGNHRGDDLDPLLPGRVKILSESPINFPSLSMYSRNHRITSRNFFSSRM